MNKELINTHALLAAGNGANKAAVSSAPINMAKARERAEEFEAMFLATMLQPMFEGLRTDGLFGGGHGEEMFRSMVIDEYGKFMAKRGGVGLSDNVLQSMIDAQEKAQ